MSTKAVNNITVNVNGAINGVSGNDDKKSRAAGRKTLFAGDLGIGPGVQKNGHNKENPLVEQKKAMASKQAKKLISDAWERDSKVSDAIDEMNKYKEEHVDDLVAARNELNDIHAQQEALADIEDEQEREARSIELERQETYTSAKVQQGEGAVMALSAAVTDAKIDQLKHHDMVDADKDADKIMEAANKEIMGMLINDAKSKLDEDLEKVKEEAEKRAEEKKELEEKIEETKEKRKEQEELIEKAAEESKAKAEQLSDKTGASNMEEAQKSVQDILKEHGLLDEDILGIDVDKKL